MIFRWTILVFQDLFGINSGYLQPGPQGVCFSEPLGPGYGTSTVPWVKTLQGGFFTVENLPIWGILSEKKPLKSTNLHQKLRVWKHQFFIIQDIRDIHWSLAFVKMGMRGNSPFNKNRGQMKGAIIWGHETGETSLAIRRFSYLLLDGHIFSWVHPKHLQRIQLSTMKGIDSFWGCFEFQEMKQLLNLDWMKSFSNFHWVFTGSPLKFLGKWTHYTMKQYSNS